MIRSDRRDRWALLTGLGGTVALAWVYLILRAGRMGGMSSGMEDQIGVVQVMMRISGWTPTEYVLTLLMWAVMMIAMMVPSATPMTLLYAAVARKAQSHSDPVPRTFVFVAGYVAVWTTFSLAATTFQMLLERAALLSPALVSVSPVLGGALLIGAGVYQLTPAKQACLQHCRSPAHFLSKNWRRGTVGAFVMGLHHGAYCLGCCWVLMGLLFVGGVMNLLWVAAIAVLVLVEKTLSFGAVAGRVVGTGMVLVGVLALAGFVTLG